MRQITELRWAGVHALDFSTNEVLSAEGIVPRNEWALRTRKLLISGKDKRQTMSEKGPFFLQFSFKIFLEPMAR
jgi:hypothetical protein